MSIFRLILWGLIIYFVYRLVKGLFLPAKQPDRETSVRGRPRKNSLDLNEADIEDANYRDLEDK